jgi:hypothetical protein
MRKQQIENAAYEVATQVRTVEDSIETALAEIADLQSKMVHARGVTRAGFVTSHAAFEQLAMTVGSLVAATRPWSTRSKPFPACAPSPLASPTNVRPRSRMQTCESSPSVERPGCLVVVRPPSYA